MPFTGASFRLKHAHGLTDAQAEKAAAIANAILKDSGDEGMAIATAIARVKGKKRQVRKKGINWAAQRGLKGDE